MKNTYQGYTGEDATGVGEKVVPVAGAARAEELTQFQGGAQQKEKDHGHTNAAATEAVQIGEGGEDCIGGKVLDLVVDSTQVNEVHYAALGGREAAGDHSSETNQPKPGGKLGGGGCLQRDVPSVELAAWLPRRALPSRVPCHGSPAPRFPDRSGRVRHAIRARMH